MWYAVFRSISNSEVWGWNPMVLPFKWNLFSSTFALGTVYLVCSSNFRVWGWTAVVWPFKLNRAILCVFSLIFHKGKFGLFSVKKIDCWPLQKQKKRRCFRLITWSRLWQPMNGCNFFQSFFAGFWNKTTLTKECWLFHLPQYFAGWRSLLW